MHTTPMVEMEATEILEQGCYMHLATGLLMRVAPEDVPATRERLAGLEASRVLRLSDNPNAPIVLRREAALGARYVPRF